MTSGERSKLLVWVSRVAIIIGLIPLFFVQPLCDCPLYFIGIAAIGLVPLVCGPRLYRWLGAGYTAVALLFAQMPVFTGHLHAQAGRGHQNRSSQTTSVRIHAKGLTMRWSERRSAVRSTFEMISTLPFRATRAVVRRRSSCSR